jgi:SAM-dependent methyltransferase
MIWQFRFLRNAVFAAVPGFVQIRRWKRALVPYDATVDEDTVQQGLEMIGMLRRAGCRVRGATVVEYGSGWKPVIPLLMRLAGARRVYMVDAEELLDVRLLRAVVVHLRGRVAELASKLETTERALLDALLVPGDGDALADATERLGLTYLAPFDGRALPLAPGEATVVCSRAVLEHIPVEVLRAIFAECARVLPPGDGFMCHIIDNSDHWAHGDKRLSMLNFLRYSGRVWRWLALNPLDFMNRLRHSEYLTLMKAAGFEIASDDSSPDARALADLRHLPVDPAFRHFDPADTATLTSRIVAVRAPN